MKPNGSPSLFPSQKNGSLSVFNLFHQQEHGFLRGGNGVHRIRTAIFPRERPKNYVSLSGIAISRALYRVVCLVWAGFASNFGANRVHIWKKEGVKFMVTQLN